MARSKVTLKFRQAGFAEIRTSPKAMALVNDAINETARRAGPGHIAYPAKATGGRVRGRGAVATASRDAEVNQARNHTLEKALGGGSDA